MATYHHVSSASVVSAVRRLIVGRTLSSSSSRPTLTDYPPYEIPKQEPETIKRKRLLYQSRKRGISENGLLLSTFADRYLNDLSREQLDQFDILMNHPSNEWDIYYWATGREMTPSYYDNSVMDLLKKHTQNDSKETRYRQPDL